MVLVGLGGGLRSGYLSRGSCGPHGLEFQVLVTIVVPNAGGQQIRRELSDPPRVIIDRMIAASASRTAEPAEHNVPVPLTSLIGRSRELDGIGEVLRRTRLVTLTGPGGVGKTRLATEVARRQIGRRPDGVWLVDLTAGPTPPPRLPGRSTSAAAAPLRRPSRCAATSPIVTCCW